MKSDASSSLNTRVTALENGGTETWIDISSSVLYTDPDYSSEIKYYYNPTAKLAKVHLAYKRWSSNVTLITGLIQFYSNDQSTTSIGFHNGGFKISRAGSSTRTYSFVVGTSNITGEFDCIYSYTS